MNANKVWVGLLDDKDWWQGQSDLAKLLDLIICAESEGNK